MYNPRDIIDTIANNVKQTHNPFGIPRFMVNRWHKGLDLPRRGKGHAVYRSDVPVRALY